MRVEYLKIGELDYLIRYPENYKDGEEYPAIIFLHGAGTRGEKIEIVLQNPFFSVTAKYEDFPFICVAPVCSGYSWFDHIPALKELARTVSARGDVDSTRLYLMGNSMGGYGSWYLAQSAPDLFAAIVPICGGGMYWDGGRLLNTPVWAFHGAKDTTVLPEESEKMVASLKRAGGEVELTVYPDAAHNSWDATYQNYEVFKWLLSHKKENKNKIVDSISGNSKVYG